MSAIVSPTAQRMLEEFLAEACSPAAFEEWLVAAADDDGTFESERLALLGLRLAMLECGEGLRTIEDLRGAVASLLIEAANAPAAVWSGSSPRSQATFALDPLISFKPTGSPV